MNIYVYSDESGVFDKVHNDYFVFGGLLFLSKREKEDATRKYISAERVIYENKEVLKGEEIKASKISNKSKGKLYRSLNQFHKFGVVVDQKRIRNEIQANKKSKQRYLDYAYKIGVKRKLERLIEEQVINPDDIENIFFYVDEHTTATNGLYELQECIEQEFKVGTFNWNYESFYPPLFNYLKKVKVNYCDSKTKTLVRAADIVANKLYHETLKGNVAKLQFSLMNICFLP